MPAPLPPEEAAALGVTTSHERMDNGELRFRLQSDDGSKYCRTQASGGSGWQNSHLHHTTYEMNVVQAGAVLVVTGTEDGHSLRLCRAEDWFLSLPGVPHNCYLYPGAVLHTVKFGAAIAQGDWIADPALDALCRTLDVEDLFNTEQ